MARGLVETILARRSIRKYTDEPLSEEDIKTLLEAAMAAPLANDSQPWHFVVVADRETLDALAEAHPNGKMLFQAPPCGPLSRTHPARPHPDPTRWPPRAGSRWRSREHRAPSTMRRACIGGSGRSDSSIRPERQLAHPPYLFVPGEDGGESYESARFPRVGGEGRFAG